MPARNIHHDAVVEALVADGWVITDDPLYIAYGGHGLFVDLGVARSLVQAEKGGERRAVEIQSFIGPSAVNDFHRAVGQCLIYRTVLAETDPGVPLYLAISQKTFLDTFDDAFGRLILDRLIRQAVVFDTATRRIVQWIG
jgi:hypothetical protein